MKKDLIRMIIISRIAGLSMNPILTLWTNDPEYARWAETAGITRAGLDLETIGKNERQKNHSTWVSSHTIEDFPKIIPELNTSQVFARINPIHSGTKEEINQLLRLGVDIIMLPNFTVVAEVEDALNLIQGRATLVPLVERRAAIACIPHLAKLGISEIHVGLNDLSIELKLNNRLHLLSLSLMDEIAHEAHKSELTLCVGGLGRANDRSLPIPSDLVYAQLGRLKANGSLIARSFFNAPLTQDSFLTEINNLRQRLRYWHNASQAKLDEARIQLFQSSQSIEIK